MKRILMSCLLCIGLALPGMVMSEEHENKASVSLYGRLWPKVTYTNPSDGDPSTDIKDALSRIGVSADYKLSETLTAVLQAEMRVNLGADGSQDFLTEHLGYVGLQGSDFGLLAIGTQWNPYYNIVAEVTDVYYHRSSPFGYDNDGPFREEQIVRYARSFGGLKLDLGVQVKDQSGEDFDKVYAGVGYSYGPVYVGVGYLSHEMAPNVTEIENLFLEQDTLYDENGRRPVRRETETTSTPRGRRDYLGIGASLNVTDDLYLAVTYQSIRYEIGKDHDSLDVAASYAFDMGYTLTGGFFTYDDDTETSDPDHVGYNLTLIKALNNNVKVFAEWLRKDFQDGVDKTDDQLSLGIRIDFNAKLL